MKYNILKKVVYGTALILTLGGVAYAQDCDCNQISRDANKLTKKLTEIIKEGEELMTKRLAEPKNQQVIYNLKETYYELSENINESNRLEKKAIDCKCIENLYFANSIH